MLLMSQKFYSMQILDTYGKMLMTSGVYASSVILLYSLHEDWNKYHTLNVGLTHDDFEIYFVDMKHWFRALHCSLM